MNDFNSEIAPLRRTTSGGGVVEMPSPLKKFALQKALPLGLAALSIAGGIKAVTNSASADEGGGSEHSIVMQLQEHDAPKGIESTSSADNLFDIAFHDLDSTQASQARQKVEDFKNKIAAKPDYIKAHREVPQEYAGVIQETAQVYGISEGALSGIIAIENGGGTDVANEASGAVGVAQFLPDTARQYGLLVNENIDQRKDPVLSIDAAGRYLRDHKALFNGDEGLAIWSYHAGAGVVFNAMREYFKDVNGVDIGDYAGTIVANDAKARQAVEDKARELMKKDKLDAHKLLSNNAVQKKVIANLEDYSDTYIYQAVAADELSNATPPLVAHR